MSSELVIRVFNFMDWATIAVFLRINGYPNNIAVIIEFIYSGHKGSYIPMFPQIFPKIF